MTKETLEQRKALLREGFVSLQQQISKLQSDLLATDGALQEVDYWLGQIEDQE